MSEILPEKTEETTGPLFKATIAKLNLFLLFNLFLVILLGIIFNEQVITGSFFLESGMFLISLGWVIVQRMDFKTTLSIKLPRFKEVMVALVVIIIGIYTASFIDQLFRYFLQNMGAIPDLKVPNPTNFKELMFSIVGIALLPAVSEEVLFRGVILKGYTKYLSTGKAVFLSALLFGFAHLSISNFWGPFILGLICGWLVMSFHSIWLAILAHFINNGLTIIFLYLKPDLGMNRVTSLTDLIVEVPFFVIIGLLLLMIILFYKPAIKETSLNRNRLREVFRHWSTWILGFIFLIFSALELIAMTGN